MNEEKIISFLKIGMGFAILFAVYKLFQKFGIINDKNDRTADKLIQSGTNGSPLNPNYWREHYKTGVPATKAFASIIAKQIWDAKGSIYDTDGQALNAIRQLNSKSKVSYVSYIFGVLYSRDLAEYLNFMDNSSMALAHQHINSLPKK